MAYGNPIRIIPPLTISEKTALEGAAILEEVFELAAKKGLHKQ